MHLLNSTLNTIEHDYITPDHKATIGIVNGHAGMELRMALDGSGTISGDGSGEVGRRRNANKFRKAIFGSTLSPALIAEYQLRLPDKKLL